MLKTKTLISVKIAVAKLESLYRNSCLLNCGNKAVKKTLT